MRAPLALAAFSLLLAGCDRLDREAMVLTLEPGWTAQIVATEKDGLASPDGLLWSDGTLYIADEGGSAVRAWRPGERIRTLAGPEDGLASPEDVARGEDGTLYVSDDSTGGILAIGPSGRIRLPSPPTEGLAVAAGGLLAGDAEGHRILALAGAAPLPHRIAKPESFAWDGRGGLYVADNRDRILYLVTAEGRLHRPIADQRGFSPESIHHDGRRLLITDSEHGKLLRYSPEEGLTAIALFGGTLANIQGVTSDEAGNVYVSVQSDLKGRRGYILRLSPPRAPPAPSTAARPGSRPRA